MATGAVEQVGGAAQHALAHRAIGVQPDADLAFGMQHVVLVVQRQHRGVDRAHTNTSNTSCASSQFTRSTRFMRMRQPSPSAASLWV